MNKDKSINLKYLPLELACAAPVKSSIAKTLLSQVLSHGLSVFKYGRHGAAKNRTLWCNEDVTKLYWTDIHTTSCSESHCVSLVDVIEVRAAVDLDPRTTTAALRAAAARDEQDAIRMLQQREAAGNLACAEIPHHKSFMEGLFHTNAADEELMYGTATLRAGAKPVDFAYCVSLVTAERSYDFQCYHKRDQQLLYINLKEIVNKLRNPTVLLPSAAPALRSFKRALSSKHSPAGHTGDSARSAGSGVGTGSGVSDCGHNPQTFSDEVCMLDSTMRSISGLDGLPVIASGSTAASTPAPSSAKSSPYSLKSRDALMIGLALSKEEERLRENAGSLANPVNPANPTSQQAENEPQRATSSAGARAKVSTMNAEGGTVKEEYSAPADAHVTSERTNRAQDVSSSVIADPYAKIAGAANGLLYRPASQRNLVPQETCYPHPILRMTAAEALQTGLLLSQQEAEFGTNMYDSLETADVETMHELVGKGYTNAAAVLKIFQKKFGKTGPLKSCLHRVQVQEESLLLPAPPPAVILASSGAPRQSEQQPPCVAVRQVEHPLPPATVDNHVDLSARPGVEYIPADKKPPSTASGSVCATHHTEDSSVSGCSTYVHMPTSLSETEAMHMALLLSEQESEYGINMYDSLGQEDEPELQNLIARGYTIEQAVLRLFERRYVPDREPSPPLQPLHRTRAPQRDVYQPPPAAYEPPPGPGYYVPAPQQAPMYAAYPPSQMSYYQPSYQQPQQGFYQQPGQAYYPQPQIQQYCQQQMPNQAYYYPQGPYPQQMMMQPELQDQYKPPTPAQVALCDDSEVENGAQRGGNQAELRQHKHHHRHHQHVEAEKTATTASQYHPQEQRPQDHSVDREPVLHAPALETNLFVPPRMLNHPISPPSHSQTMSPPSPEKSYPSTNAKGSKSEGAISDAMHAVRHALIKPVSFFMKSDDGHDPEEAARRRYKQEDLDALTDMGYNAEIAAWALMENDNVLPLAVEALMRSEHFM